MGETLGADLLEAKPSNRPHLATFMTMVSGVGALLALSFAVAPVSADRLWTFVLFSVAVFCPGAVVWLCRRVGVNELFLQNSLTSWVLFLLGLISPMGMPTIPSTLGFAVAGLVVTNVILWTGNVGRSAHSVQLWWCLLARAVSWHLLGVGLLLMPLAILYWLLGLGSVE